MVDRKVDESIVLLNSVLGCRMHSENIYYWAARIYAYNRNWNQAFKYLEQELSINKKSGKALYLGVIMSNKIGDGEKLNRYTKLLSDISKPK